MLESYKVEIQKSITAVQNTTNFSELELAVSEEDQIAEISTLVDDITDIIYTQDSTPIPLYDLGNIDNSYLLKSQYETEEEHSNLQGVEDPQSETMEPEEAYKTMHDISFAVIMGDKTKVDYQTRKRLDTWIKFNRVHFRLMEMNMPTNDVDYSA